MIVLLKKKIKMTNLDQNTWWSQFLQDANGVIVDVRTEDEFNDGFIPGAINIDIYKGQGFIYRVEELDKSKKLLCVLRGWCT